MKEHDKRLIAKIDDVIKVLQGVRNCIQSGTGSPIEVIDVLYDIEFGVYNQMIRELGEWFEITHGQCQTEVHAK